MEKLHVVIAIVTITFLAAASIFVASMVYINPGWLYIFFNFN